MQGANKKQKPTLLKITSNFSLSWAMLAPAANNKSALPDLLDTALLPCLVTDAPPAAATKDEAVEQLKVCIPTPLCRKYLYDLHHPMEN